MQGDDYNWKSLLFELVKKEGMDPWDVNISALAKKYLETIHNLKSDLKLSGKVLLAAALLLRMKSSYLLSNDISAFDQFVSPKEDEDLYDALEKELVVGEKQDVAYELMPRVPTARKRKVSVYDLVKALEQAIEVKNRRENRLREIPVMSAPERKFDIKVAIEGLYSRLLDFFGSKKHALFSQVSGTSKKDRVFTFIPMLHLASQRKIKLEQQEHFGEIYIYPEEKSEIKQE